MTEHAIALYNGVRMPLLGLGVYKTISQLEMDLAVSSALESGYRSFDTAQMYKNEPQLGNALAHSGISRESLFLTSKVDNNSQGYYSTLRAFEMSLSRLKTDYLDLFLIHWPGQKKERCLDTWQAMIDLQKRHRVRAIGVCNCLPFHLEWLEESGTRPAVNQIERNPLNRQDTIATYCREKGIAVEAWAPLIRGNLEHPAIIKIAAKHHKTPAQVVLRWNVQNNIIVIPKSTHKERIAENADIFDFFLTKEEITCLDAMDTGRHTSYNLATFDF